MDYTYEVDLADGKTIQVTYDEKVGTSVFFGDDESEGCEPPRRAYSDEELIKKLKKKTTFSDSNGNTYASDAVVSARLIT
jgi:hypothetical protein